MILSASGWRKIFAISNDEQDKTSLIGEENIALSVLAAKVFSDYLKAKTKKEIKNLKLALANHNRICYNQSVVSSS